MKWRGGFTLLEVLISISILAGGIIVVSSTWSGNLMRIRKSNLFNSVSFLLEGKVAEIEAKYHGKPLEEIPEEESGDFEGFPDYRWQMKSAELEMPDLTAVIMAQNGGTADETMLSMVKQMTELISKSVKEVKVSVFVKSGAREVEFHLTTYMVDYNKEISLGLGQ